MGAYQAAIDRVERGGDFLNWQPRPWAEHKQSVTAHDPATLLHGPFRRALRKFAPRTRRDRAAMGEIEQLRLAGA